MEINLERQLLFTPCKNKEELGGWINHFLGYNLPDCVVDADSNSSPLDLIWEIYKEAVFEQTNSFDRILAYASRGGMKTLGASALEILMLFHDRRDVVHLAALEQQSIVCLEYVKSALRHPALQPFEIQGDKRSVTIQSFYKDGIYLSPKEYKELIDKTGWREFINSIDIIVATPKACNGLHASILILDETDLLDNDVAFNEAQGVPHPTKDERHKNPITYLTSTRKKSTGRVQDLINKAKEENIYIRHWNIIDITKPCPPEKHKPNLPKLNIYVDDNSLKAISEEAYNELNSGEQVKYTKNEMFAGCAGCKLAPTCKSRLATHQKSTSEMLLKHSFVETQVTRGNLEFIKSQILCRKPLSTGSIFSRFNRERHLLTAAQIYERIEQQTAPKKFGKKELVSYLKSHPQVRFYGGMDFGYTHLFVAVLAAKIGKNIYVLECVAASELETMECVDLCNKTVHHYGATWYPDPENRQLITTFIKAGYNCVDWSKNKGSVLGGIDAVRAKLHPGPDMEPELFFLSHDESISGNEGSLAEAFEKWSWKLNAVGEPTEVPQEQFKDLCDATRYLIMNAAPLKGIGLRGGVGAYKPREKALLEKTTSERFWDMIKEEGIIAGAELNNPDIDDPNQPKKRKKFYF